MYSRVFKANPYHAKDGRFTDAPSAHFVNTGVVFEKTLARQREALKAKEAEAAKLVFTPAVQTESGLRAFAKNGAEKTQADWSKLPPAARAAVFEYTGQWHKRINKKLGGKTGTSATDELVDEKIAALDKAMQGMEAHENMVVYRAMNVNRILGTEGLNWMSEEEDLKNLTGATFVDKGFGSSTVSRSLSQDFLSEERVLMEINIPKGSKGVWVGGDPEDTGLSKRSRYPDEYEFILPRDRVYTVTGVKEVIIDGEPQKVLSVELNNPKTAPKPLTKKPPSIVI